MRRRLSRLALYFIIAELVGLAGAVLLGGLVMAYDKPVTRSVVLPRRLVPLSWHCHCKYTKHERENLTKFVSNLTK